MLRMIQICTKRTKRTHDIRIISGKETSFSLGFLARLPFSARVCCYHARMSPSSVENVLYVGMCHINRRLCESACIRMSDSPSASVSKKLPVPRKTGSARRPSLIDFRPIRLSPRIIFSKTLFFRGLRLSQAASRLRESNTERARQGKPPPPFCIFCALPSGWTWRRIIGPVSVTSLLCGFLTGVIKKS